MTPNDPRWKTAGSSAAIQRALDVEYGKLTQDADALLKAEGETFRRLLAAYRAYGESAERADEMNKIDMGILEAPKFAIPMLAPIQKPVVGYAVAMREAFKECQRELIFIAAVCESWFHRHLEALGATLWTWPAMR